MIDESPITEDRRTSAYDFDAKTIVRLADIPNCLLPPITFTWQDFHGVIQVGTDVYPSDLRGVVVSGDPDTSAIKLSVEQVMYAATLRVLHDSENEIAKSLDRIVRRDVIAGMCPDCAVWSL
jgi:hypothetical protein